MSFHLLTTVRDFSWKDSFSGNDAWPHKLSPVCRLVLLMPMVVSLMMAALEMTGMALASADMSEVYGIVAVMARAWRNVIERLQTMWEADNLVISGSLITFFWVLKEISLP